MKPLYSMLLILGIYSSPSWAQEASSENDIKIATFDSGFGGYFTAKAIENSANKLNETYKTHFKIEHFGDTANAPYGERPPEEIAQLTTQGVLRAFEKGADMVFIACNTASTQYSAVHAEISKKMPERAGDIIPIIDTSALEAKRQIDARLRTQNEVNFAILATPATLKSGAYPTSIAKLYGKELTLPPLTPSSQERWFKEKGQTIENFTGVVSFEVFPHKKVHLYQLAPANWAEMVERDANLKDRSAVITRDLSQLEALLPQNKKLDGVGLFCTHYPALEANIQSVLKGHGKAKEDAFFIKQGALMADIFEKRILSKIEKDKRSTPETPEERTKNAQNNQPTIEISGDNEEATRRTARSVFPHDPEPVITKVSLPSFQAQHSLSHGKVAP